MHLFDLVDYPATPAKHACAGDTCQVCALTRTSAAAKNLGTTKPKKDPAWADEAARYLRALEPWDTFTADDLIREIGLPDGTPNQVGACIRAWAVEGRIQPSGYTAANRKSSHGRVLRVWQVRP